MRGRYIKAKYIVFKTQEPCAVPKKEKGDFHYEIKQ